MTPSPEVALPPPVVAGALTSVRHVRAAHELRERHQERASRLKTLLGEAGLPVMPSSTHIVPVLVGQDDVAIRFWKGLWEERIFTTPSLAPAVPPGEAIIRASVNANHTAEQLDRLLRAFETVGKCLGVI